MFFASLHSSKRKFATVQYVNKEKFFSPYLHSLFVIRSSARATRTVFCSLFVRSLFVHCSSFLRLFFVFCSSFVRLFFVLCSSFLRSSFVFCSFIVRLLFVFSLSACAARTVFCSSTRVTRTVFLLPVHSVHSAMIACRATTAHTTRTVVLTVHLLII